MRVLLRLLKVFLPLAVLAVAGFTALTIVRNRPEVETQPLRIEPPGVRIHVVELEDVRLSVTSQATVRPRTETQLVPEISGRVTSVAPSFAEGGFFDAGDVLVTIDPFDYEQAVVSVRSQLAQSRLRLAQEEAEAEVARREWQELGLGDPRELTLREPQLDDARAAVAAAEANLLRAQRDLERAEITAPYAGRVRYKNVDVGQFVTVGNGVATIYAVDVAEIRLPLPDDQLVYLDLPLSFRGTRNRPGPRVTVRTTFAGATYTWDGRVVRTESEIDPVSRMVHVVAEVRDPYLPGTDPNRPPLAVGMYVEAEIEGREFDQVVVLPRAAVRGQVQVLVIDANNRVRFRDVEIFRSTIESVFVSGGLAQGERVVVSTIDSPTEGMLVQVTNPTEDLLARSADPVSPADEEQTAAAVPRPEPTSAISQQPVQPARPAQPAWLRDVLADGDNAGVRAAAATAAPPIVEAAAPRPTPATPATAAPPVVEATAPQPAPANAVAVLPFTNLSQEAADVEIGTAVAQELSDRLAMIKAVALVPSLDGASWVVGGGIQRLGETVRVTARLVDADAGRVVSSIKVDGSLGDLPGLREDVATAVSNSVREALGIETEPMRAAVPEANTVAIRAFSNVSGVPEDGALARALGRAVAAHLTTLETVTVVASEGNATWVVTGGIQRVGDVIRITARLVDRRKSAVVQAVKVDGSIDELARLQHEVAAAMGNGVRQMLVDGADAP